MTQNAIEAVLAGHLVVIPTDTVYGLAARPDLPGAVAAIYAAKGRPEDKPIPVLAASAAEAARVAVLDERALALAARFWPGPLTLVLLRAEGFDADLGGGETRTVAVRVPARADARAILEATGPLAVTSANRSGEPEAVTVHEAQAALGDAVAVYVDGGRVGGTASTVVSLTGDPVVLRRGALDPDVVLAAVAGPRYGDTA